MASTQQHIEKFHQWRNKHISTKTFIIILSILIGISSGFVAVMIKNAVKIIYNLKTLFVNDAVHQSYFFVLPIFGIALALLFIRFVVRRPIRPGIPNILYSISKRKGYIRGHNTYSSVVASALTVGFGGSVGLEGPTAGTCAAIGSQISRFFLLEYKYTILMLACACAGSMAAIFKAPVAAIVFAVEVIMIDLTTFSLIPLLLASSSAVLTSYLFMGMDVLYPFRVDTVFNIAHIPLYVILGIVCGLVSAYFIHTYIGIDKLFARVKNTYTRLLIGCATLGIIIFTFPALYGEGYEAINSCLTGNPIFLFENSLFYSLHENIWAITIFALLVGLFKVFATQATFGAGGIGGIFAPTLFTGVHIGFAFGLSIKNFLGIHSIEPRTFALIGMGGLIAGVLHAPLTGIFLIADLSGGYKLFVPLMISASFAYLTVKALTPNSIYNIELAKRKQLVTHHRDKHVLSIMKVPQLIENDFLILKPDAKLRDLVNAIEKSHRNLFPIVDDNGKMLGMVKMDDVRNLIFKHEKYDKITIKELMYMPEHWITPRDSMDEVVEKFENSGRFNLAVIDNGKYLGFISRANVFSVYRSYIKDFSHD